MPRSRLLTHSALAAIFVLLLGAAFLAHRLHAHGDSAAMSNPIEEPSHSPPKLVRAAPAVAAPRLALSIAGPIVAQSKDNSVSDRDPGAEETVLDNDSLEAAAIEERALMARTWRMTEEQHRRFETAATTVPHQRKAVYEQLSRGELAGDAFYKALEEADARDTSELREILGEHYLEYTLMRGHFAEAGLEHKPFEPPKKDP